MQNKLPRKLLIIEDDEDQADLLKTHFKAKGYEVEIAFDALGPLSRLRRAAGEAIWDTILTDLNIPGMTGLEFIQAVHKLDPHLPVILITAHGTVENAVEAIKEGAYDFVLKPINLAELTVTVDRALKHNHLTVENHRLRAVLKDNNATGSMIAKSPGMKAVINLIERIATSHATVLVSGESGTGKELVAKAIHRESDRNTGPFVAINCAAIPETLLESELFGFAKGSFTGAVSQKVGLFEEATGGTLFLDEIGDLSFTLQAKLLRAIQEKQIKRIGENQQRDIDVRIVAATHKNLEEEVREGRFREDLYFRLKVIPIHIPPLRERREDIFPLADHVLRRFALAYSRPVKGFSRDALEFLSHAQWKGNVRELENTIERAVVLCASQEITQGDLQMLTLGSCPSSSNQSAGRLSEFRSEEVERWIAGLADEELPTLEAWQLAYIQSVVKRVNGVREKARRILGIDRKTLYNKMNRQESRADVESDVQLEQSAALH